VPRVECCGEQQQAAALQGDQASHVVLLPSAGNQDLGENINPILFLFYFIFILLGRKYIF
jgi:hypothetical protein